MNSNRPVGITILGALMCLGGLLSLTILLIPGAASSSSVMLFIVVPGITQLAIGLGFFKGYPLSWWLLGFASVSLAALFITVGILSLSSGAPATLLSIPTESADASTSLFETMEALFILGTTGIIYAYTLTKGVREWFGIERIKPLRAVSIHLGTGIFVGLAVYFASID